MATVCGGRGREGRKAIGKDVFGSGECTGRTESPCDLKADKMTSMKLEQAMLWFATAENTPPGCKRIEAPSGPCEARRRGAGAQANLQGQQ